MRLALVAALVTAALCGPVSAQDRPAPPDQIEAARLVWSTLIALDQANRTGNYSVLRDLGAPGFRETNTAADLAMIFSKLRAQDPGLGRVLLASPVFSSPPQVLENGQLHMAGHFPGRPVGVGFELLFQPVGGEWRLFGISVAPINAAAAAPQSEPLAE